MSVLELREEFPSGFLQLYRVEDGNKVWSRRWFVIQRGEVKYGRTPEKMERHAALKGASVKEDEKRASDHQFVVSIPSVGKLHLRASSRMEMIAWISAFRSAVGLPVVASVRKSNAQDAITAAVLAYGSNRHDFDLSELTRAADEEVEVTMGRRSAELERSSRRRMPSSVPVETEEPDSTPLPAKPVPGPEDSDFEYEFTDESIGSEAEDLPEDPPAKKKGGLFSRSKKPSRKESKPKSELEKLLKKLSENVKHDDKMLQLLTKVYEASLNPHNDVVLIKAGFPVIAAKLRYMNQCSAPVIGYVTAFRTLGNVCGQHDRAKEVLSELGVLDSVLDAMDQWSGHSEVLEAAMFVMTSLSFVRPNTPLIAEPSDTRPSGLEMVISAMVSFPLSNSIQKWGTFILYFLAKNSRDRLCRQIRRKGGKGAVMAAMSSFPDDPFVLRNCNLLLPRLDKELEADE